jgi:LysM repeat protein
MLWKIAETAFGAGHYNASVSAIKELNQLAGLSVHRAQNININADLNTMSKADIKERLAKLLSVEVSDPSSKDF